MIKSFPFFLWSESTGVPYNASGALVRGCCTADRVSVGFEGCTDTQCCGDSHCVSSWGPLGSFGKVNPLLYFFSIPHHWTDTENTVLHLMIMKHCCIVSLLYLLIYPGATYFPKGPHYELLPRPKGKRNINMSSLQALGSWMKLLCFPCRSCLKKHL